jgi:hypothetical protein
MSLHSWEFQKGIYSTLDSATINDVGGSDVSVFDDIPAGTAYPYIVVGDSSQVNISTKTLDIHEYTINLHVWSQYRGKAEVKQIMDQIYTSLHDNGITLTGATLVDIKQEFEETFVESDGITRHGVMRFRAVVSDS